MHAGRKQLPNCLATWPAMRQPASMLAAADHPHLRPTGLTMCGGCNQHGEPLTIVIQVFPIHHTCTQCRHSRQLGRRQAGHARLAQANVCLLIAARPQLKPRQLVAAITTTACMSRPRATGERARPDPERRVVPLEHPLTHHPDLYHGLPSPDSPSCHRCHHLRPSCRASVGGQQARVGGQTAPQVHVTAGRRPTCAPCHHACLQASHPAIGSCHPPPCRTPSKSRS